MADISTGIFGEMAPGGGDPKATEAQSGSTPPQNGKQESQAGTGNPSGESKGDTPVPNEEPVKPQESEGADGGETDTDAGDEFEEFEAKSGTPEEVHPEKKLPNSQSDVTAVEQGGDEKGKNQSDQPVSSQDAGATTLADDNKVDARDTDSTQGEQDDKETNLNVPDQSADVQTSPAQDSKMSTEESEEAADDDANIPPEDEGGSPHHLNPSEDVVGGVMGERAREHKPAQAKPKTAVLEKLANSQTQEKGNVMSNFESEAEKRNDVWDFVKRHELSFLQGEVVRLIVKGDKESLEEIMDLIYNQGGVTKPE